jgi:hypothetical protein
MMFLLAIPTIQNGGNHTSAFTDAARTIEAHKACLNVSKALAGVGVRVLTDEAFAHKVGVHSRSSVMYSYVRLTAGEGSF